MFNFRRVFSFGANSAPSKKQRIFAGKLKSFSKDEDGIATVWAMFWLIICFALSGLAIDVTNAWKVHAILQSTADSAALAGVYELEAEGKSDDDIAVLVNDYANDFATLNMHEARYGDVLTDSDIELGYWNHKTRTYTLIGGTDTVIPAASYTNGPANAVRAITRQNSTQNTGVGTFFLRFAGFTEFTVATDAIASTFVSLCEYDGLISAGQVKLSTGQRFFNEFCIHGEEGINAAHDNFFGEGVIASTPTFDLCGQSANKCAEPVDGEVEQNPGLFDSWRQQSLFPTAETDDTKGGGKPTTELVGKPAKIGEYMDSLLGGQDATYVPEYINQSASIVEINVSNKSSLDDYIGVDGSLVGDDGTTGFQPGNTYHITCGQGNNNVELAPGDEATWDTISRVVIVATNCDFVFDASIKYYDIVIATDSTTQSTFSGSTGVTLGHHDRCDDDSITVPGGYYDPISNPTGTYYGGAVTLLTEGSVHFASELSAYDMEIIAAGDVHLASKAPTNKINGRWAPVPVDELGDSVHVGTTITTGGDISVSRAHMFNGCEGRVSSNLFDVQLSYRLVN